MYEATKKCEDRTAQERAEDRRLLKESGVHKLVILDRDGGCLAYMLAWDTFAYDAETDTYVCFAEPDGRELMTIHTEGELKPVPGTNTYVVTAPAADDVPETAYRAIGVAS